MENWSITLLTKFKLHDLPEKMAPSNIRTLAGRILNIGLFGLLGVSQLEAFPLHNRRSQQQCRRSRCRCRTPIHKIQRPLMEVTQASMPSLGH